MTVVCRPAGRGNLDTLVLVISGTRAQPLTVQVGDTFELGGITWRVCEVKA